MLSVADILGDDLVERVASVLGKLPPSIMALALNIANGPPSTRSRALPKEVVVFRRTGDLEFDGGYAGGRFPVFRRGPVPVLETDLTIERSPAELNETINPVNQPSIGMMADGESAAALNVVNAPV